MSVTADAPSGGGGRKPTNVELNLVPFIDMMSCLVAFLLITAVWTNIGQLDVRGGGRPPSDVDRAPPRTLSVLVAADSLWLGSSDGDRVRLVTPAGDRDWGGLARALVGVRPEDTVEVGGEDRVVYGDLVAAIDVVSGTGHGVSVMSADELAVRFRR
jgi:biopolymer transport protein TolR